VLIVPVKYNISSQKLKIIIYARSFKETLPVTKVKLSYEILFFPCSTGVVELQSRLYYFQLNFTYEYEHLSLKNSEH